MRELAEARDKPVIVQSVADESGLIELKAKLDALKVRVSNTILKYDDSSTFK